VSTIKLWEKSSSGFPSRWGGMRRKRRRGVTGEEAYKEENKTKSVGCNISIDLLHLNLYLSPETFNLSPLFSPSLLVVTSSHPSIYCHLISLNVPTYTSKIAIDFTFTLHSFYPTNKGFPQIPKLEIRVLASNLGPTPLPIQLRCCQKTSDQLGLLLHRQGGSTFRPQ
jgi:hypothetical protein